MTSASRNFRDLLAWQRAMDLVQAVYALTADFPPDERFGLTSQLRRAAVSVPSNIAEGQGRGSRADFGRFLAIAYASLREVETQLLIAVRLEYTSERQCHSAMCLTEEVGRLINGLARSLDRAT
ncbi:MAG: four helix bundle protein [Chloroflexota bacterium]